MKQVAQILSGERDYSKIYGNTGPLVYPAAHPYIYTGLYHMNDQGKDILGAQKLFGVLHMATLAVVMTCYLRAKVPRRLMKPRARIIHFNKFLTGRSK